MNSHFALHPLPRSFYLDSTIQVAKKLLGKYFVRRLGKNILIGKIVETEAYLRNDPASHSYNGRTERNDVMFWEGGYLYVYFTYGMHFCANVVTGKKGKGEAALIRSIEPISGIEEMAKNRFPNVKSINLHKLINLTNGPAKFCQAFGIARKENGIDLLGNKIFIVDLNSDNCKIQYSSSPRIGIRNGKEKKWRFFIKGNLWVSK